MIHFRGLLAGWFWKRVDWWNLPEGFAHCEAGWCHDLIPSAGTVKESASSCLGGCIPRGRQGVLPCLVIQIGPGWPVLVAIGVDLLFRRTASYAV